MSKVDEVWDFILENKICTEETLRIITAINGYSIETLNDVIYYKTGVHDVEQLWDYCREEFEGSEQYELLS